MFKLFDKDGNGLITKEELRGGLGQMGQQLTENDVEQIFEEADLDGDGMISYEEFEELMKGKW